MLDANFSLEPWSLLCAAAISVPHFVGCYLFRAGVNDYKKGCTEVGVHLHWSIDWLQMLKVAIPSCAVLRIFCAPTLWMWAANKDLEGSLRSLPVLLWVALWAVPFAMFQRILMRPGIRSVLSSHQSLREWCHELPCERPYHGLLSTRSHAANGGFFIELLWNAWVVYSAYSNNDWSFCVGGITIPLFIFNAGMLMGGPVNFLSRGPAADTWIAETYILVSLGALEGFLLLNHCWFGLKSAIAPSTDNSSLGPYSHWSTWAWLGVLLAQTVICRTAVTNAKELKGGPPWSCGGADHKEFYFPRFWGLIFVCYGMLISFNLWIVGMWLAPRP